MVDLPEASAIRRLAKVLSPDLDEDMGPGDVVHTGGDTYIRNTPVFIDHVRHVTKAQGEDFVKAKLPLCLREKALNLHSDRLSGPEKSGLRHTQS